MRYVRHVRHVSSTRGDSCATMEAAPLVSELPRLVLVPKLSAVMCSREGFTR